MDESLSALKKEIGQLYGSKVRLGSPEEEELIVACRHCGATVKLIGIPPPAEPGGPQIELYYPMQYCPQCGAEIGRALHIELISMPPWLLPGVPIWHRTVCPRCGSALRYKTQALPPQYLYSLHCPVCNIDLGIQGLEVYLVSAEPWPPVAPPVGVEPEVPWKPILIVGGAFTMLFIAAGIGHLLTKKT